MHPLLGSTPADLVDIMTVIKVYLGMQVDMNTETFVIARLYDRAKEEHQKREQEQAARKSAAARVQGAHRGPLGR